MPDRARTTRLGHFRRGHLLWIVVHHFLSADLMEELSVAIVEEASAGALNIDALFSRHRSGGEPALANWAVQPRALDAPFDHYLMRLIRTFVWQGDQSPGLYHRQKESEHGAVMAGLETAVDLSHADFGTIGGLGSHGQDVPDQLGWLADAIRALAANAADDVPAIAPIIVEARRKAAAPLDAILVKHLGDLCADADRWTLAAIFYAEAETLLAGCTARAWSALKAALETIIVQSRAAALLATEGAEAAAALLGMITGNDQGENLVAAINAAPDAMNARMAIEKSEFPSDDRGAVLLAPQLINSHHLAHALSAWANHNFGDAHRWFWSLLRRQIALGSATYSRHTKAQFAHCMIDDLTSRIDRQRDSASFALAVRLFIESGDAKLVELAEWNADVVEAYVDEQSLAAAVDRSKAPAGVRVERTKVLVALFGQWLRKLPADSVAPATQMIAFLARAAHTYPRKFLANHDIGGGAVKALTAIGRQRPEFRKLDAPGVAGVILAVVDRGDAIAISDVIELASVYVDSFDSKDLEHIVDRIVSLANQYEDGSGPWPIVGPVVRLLGADPVQGLVARDSAFGRRVAGAMVRLSLETETEHASIMYLLRDLDPSLIEGLVDLDRLKAVVTELRGRALRINSSGAAGDILALLVAPAVAGREGVEDAVKGLHAILFSATGDFPSIALGDAYHPLLWLAQNRAELVRGLRIDDEEAVRMVSPLLDPLLRLWQAAADSPLIFAGFSIPPRTAPNRTLVHNWTFASIGFARSLGQFEAMTEAMAGAASHPLLENAMAVARAVRVSAGDPEPFAPEAIQAEKRDTFYAALGSRLLLLQDMSGEPRDEALRALLAQCFRLGPQGLDSGLFLAAIEWDVRPATASPETEAYRVRLMLDRTLRTSLAPLYARLFAGD